MKTAGLRQIVVGWAILLSVFFAGGVFAQTTDVYFIGNSFTSTFDVPTTFKNLAASGGRPVKNGNDIIGGSALSQHWATGKATNDITTGNYDYVVLQEASSLGYDTALEANFDIYAPLYDTVITNSGAQTVLYMTWVRESALYSLTNSIAIYRNMAAQLGCNISPVGEAWRRILQQYPAIDLFSADRHHPNEKGAYMAGCNFYGTIFNATPEGLSMRTVGGFVIDATEAAIIQRIAWDAIQFVSFTNPPVISSMTVDQSVRTNSTPFMFQAAAADNGSITDYLWSFGDGTTTNGPALTHVVHDYAIDGIFPVTVKVTDNAGETERTGLTVTRDTTGPQVSDIAATRAMLTVRFNQDMQKASAEIATNYAISGGGDIVVISATQTASNTVRLEVSTLAAGVEYTLTLNNLYNALGMKIYPNTTKDFMYVDGSNLHLRFDFGDSVYPTPGNWNNVTAALGLVITNAIDIYGVERNIGLRLLGSTAPGYSWGYAYSNLYPATAQRDNIAVGRKLSYQIEGADPAAEYRLTFFASKVAATRETVYTVGTSNVVLDCAYNSNRTAVIDGIKSDASGNIVFSLNTNMNSSGVAYLSVLELEDTTPPVLKNIETGVGALDITEGTTSNIQVRLSSQPAGNVTVSVNASGYAHVQVLSESAFLYFAVTNWDVWQPVYVEALNDADTDNGTATIQIADTADLYVSTNVYATQIDTTAAAGFTASPTSGWAPLTVSFTDTSTISGITNRFWDFGDGTTTNTTATNLTHTYTSAGTSTVQLIVTGSGESGTKTQVDLIHTAVPVVPSSGFTVSTNSGTVPLTVSFTDTSTGDITARFWDFGDGAVTDTLATVVSHTYTAAGIRTVQLIVSGPGGVSTNTQIAAVTVTLPPAPVAGFTVSANSGTAPLPVTFTDTSTGSITNRFWSFGDGATTNTTATSVLHTYTSAGTNTVQLTVSGLGGADVNTQIAAVTVTLPAAPVANFSAAPTSGTTPLPVTFTDTSTGSITNRRWSFGDGAVMNTTGTSVSHTYMAAGTNTVQLIVSGLGGASTNTQTGLISVAAGSAGILLLEETFSHPSAAPLIGTTPETGGTWFTNGTGVGVKSNVFAGSLSAPAGFKPSIGNSVKTSMSSEFNGKEMHSRFTSTTVGSVIYYSFLVNFDAMSSGKGGSVIALSLDSGAEYAQLFASNTVGNSYLTLGLGGKSTSPGVWSTNQYELNTTHLIVVSYANNSGSANDVMKMWIDPAGFGGAEPAYDMTLAGFSETSSGLLNTLELKNGSSAPRVMIDEIRIGTTWASVTPSASALLPKYIETSTNLLDITEGATNSFQVRLSSQPDASVTVSVSRVSGETNLQVLSSSAVFDTTGWNVWQPVYIEALVDADTNNGTATITCADAGSTYTSTNVLATQIDTTVIPPVTDSDGDGMPDAWEIQYFGSTNANPSALAANGVNTIYETYIAGLNPTNAQSVLALSLQQASSQKLLQWSAVSGRVYSVYWATNLLNGFQPLETNILWPQNSWTDLVHGAQADGFYQFKVQLVK